MQKAEREIISSFAYRKNISLPFGDISEELDSVVGSKAVAHYSLARKIRLTEDYMEVDFKTEYEGRDLADIENKLRKVSPEFQQSNEHNKDVQVVIDENQVNYHLYTLFQAEKPFSLADLLVSVVPQEFAMMKPMLKQMMNTQVLSLFFPKLKAYGNRKADLRCSLSKDELQKGRIKGDISTIRFMDDNKINLDLHFGCSLLVYGHDEDLPKNEQAQQVEQLFSMF